MRSVIIYSALLTLHICSLEQILNDVFESDDDSLYRLPNNVTPLSYNIKIITNFMDDNTKFFGETNITIDVKNVSNNLTLHAKNLVFNSILMRDTLNNAYEPTNFTINKETDFLIIRFRELLRRGQYTINFKYTGIMNDVAKGFYRTLYRNADNKTMLLMITQFEPTGARMAFPCWDEPALKAYFTITIKHDKKYNALSNMHVMKIENDGNQTTTYFAETPKMPTYLVSFIISKFHCVQNPNSIIRLCGRSKSIRDSSSILTIAEQAISAMESATNIMYNSTGLQKLDIVVLPFTSYPGMENWGLITVRERNVFGQFDRYGQTALSISGFDYLTQIIVHEISHQWFGNLVTPEWWSDLWISEALATYYEYFISDQIAGTSRYADRFVTENLQYGVLSSDKDGYCPPSNTSIVYNNINLMATAVCLQKVIFHKSSSIIRMFAHIVGEKKFTAMIRRFMLNRKFQSISTEDFTNDFTTAVDDHADESNDYGIILKHWITTSGHPVVTVTRDYDTGIAKIVQSQFVSDPRFESKQKYWVPINYVTESNSDFQNTSIDCWLSPVDESIEISKIPEDDWLILNKQQFGYYRVNYDDKNWKSITRYLKFSNYETIHVSNRAQLIDDAFQLTSAGQLNYSILFPLLEYLTRETDVLPWYVAVNNIILNLRTELLNHPKYKKNFKAFMLLISRNMIDKIKFYDSVNDDYLIRLYRIDFLDFFCNSLGSERCLIAGRKKFNIWLRSNQTNIFSKAPAWKNLILCIGGRYMDTKTWEIIFNKWRINQDKDLLTALSCDNNGRRLKELMRIFIVREDFPKFEKLIIKMAEYHKNRDKNVLLDSFLQNWNHLLIHYSSRKYIDRINTLLYIILSTVSNADDKNKLINFIEKNRVTMERYRNSDEIIQIIEMKFATLSRSIDAFERFSL